MAFRHECAHLNSVGGGVHDAGAGKPTRKACRCGGTFRVLTGSWGTFLHSTYAEELHGAYDPERALAVFQRIRAAERWCSLEGRDPSRLAVRWIPA